MVLATASRLFAIVLPYRRTAVATVALIYALLLGLPLAMVMDARTLQREIHELASGDDRWMVNRAEFEYQAVLLALYRAAAGDRKDGRAEVQAAIDILYSRNETLKSVRNNGGYANIQDSHRAAVGAIDAAIEAADAILARAPGAELSSSQLGDLLSLFGAVEPPMADFLRDERTALAEARDAVNVRAIDMTTLLFGYIVVLALASLGLIGALAWNNRKLSATTSRMGLTTAALRNSETLQKLIADNLPATILYTDSALRLRFVNRSAQTWLARATPFLLGQRLNETMEDDLFQALHPGIQAAMGGALMRHEKRLKFPDATTRHVEIEHIPLLGNGGKVDGVVTLIEDITKRAQIEMTMRQHQRLEAVGQLTGGIAHDFNNLLGVILGNIDLLAGRLPPGSGDRKLAERAAEAVKRGASLTDRLLAFSRQQTLKPERIVANRLIGDMAELLHRALGETVRVETRLEPELWSCTVDPGQLESAILNLAMNSRDAMPLGGQLTIATANAVVDKAWAATQSEFTPGRYVAIGVADSGEGMDAETLKRAFEPFFTTKEVGKGSGLGLSMVFGFAKQSGGHVVIESQPGGGTTVTIYIPGVPDVASLAPRADIDNPTHRAGRGEKILVIEDNEAMLEFSAAVVEQLGYTPLTAVDGQAALDLLESTSDISLIFTDIILPGEINGIDLVRRARARRSDIKALFTSGYFDIGTLPGGALPGGATLLKKPFRKVELERRIGELLGSHTA